MPTLSLEPSIHRVVNRAIESQGFCFRNVWQEFATQGDIRCVEGGLTAGGRIDFNGKFGVLYLACDPHTCLEEIIHTTAFEFNLVLLFPCTIVAVKVNLSKVLNLTDGDRVRRAIGINKKVLIGTDWKANQNSGKEQKRWDVRQYVLLR